MVKNGSKPAGYKEPKVGKFCPKCHNKVSCAYQSCPCCGHAFVSVKTTRVINKPAKHNRSAAQESELASIRKAIKMIRATSLETVESILEILCENE